MVPSKNGELYRRGWDFALNRIIGGVHYRSDVEAGRICAAVIAEGMFRNPEFKHDFDASKAELRTVLSRTNLSTYRYIPLFHPEY
jgi:acid phosphatase (class A)